MKEYKIPISQAKTLYEPKEAYSTKLKTTYGKTTTIPYLSERIGNNITKLRLLEQDLYDSCGGGSKPNVPSVPVNTKGNLDIMPRISSIAGGSIMTYLGIGAITVGLTALTIATGGLALPAIAAALTGGMGATAFVASAVAVGTMVSGAGLAVMGVNEIAYGATGENVLLNNVFKGNTDLYSNTQLALTMGAVGGTQYSSGYSYQETVFRNATEGASSSTKDIKVIGRLEDTSVAKDWEGHDVLNDPNWTLAKNDAWVNSGVKNKQDFYIGSPMTERNLVSSNPKYPGETVYAREIRMLKEAGYVHKGDYFIHPDNLN